jgi:hypothetical protein
MIGAIMAVPVGIMDVDMMITAATATITAIMGQEALLSTDS